MSYGEETGTHWELHHASTAMSGAEQERFAVKQDAGSYRLHCGCLQPEATETVSTQRSHDRLSHHDVRNKTRPAGFAKRVYRSRDSVSVSGLQANCRLGLER